MKVPLLDLQAQDREIRHEIEAAVSRVLDSQRFILGPEVEALEREMADSVGVRHGIGVSSGSDALLACLMAEGIGPGDEVITSVYSFFATAGAVVRLGARPVFVDIDPATFNLDAAQVAAAVSSRTQALIPVHLFGRVAELDPLLDLADERGLVVVEDAAQAIGAEWPDGRRAGSRGHYGCFSFFPSKNLGGAGDGGMVVTDDYDRAERVRVLRNHGAEPKYHHRVVGGNFRLDALQAAILRAKLPHLDDWTAARYRNAARYRRRFAAAGLNLPLPDCGRQECRTSQECGLEGSRGLVLPALPAAGRHVFNQFVVRCSRRDALRTHLAEAGVGTEIYYPVPFHLQQCFASLGHGPGDFPAAECAAARALALPVYPEMTEEQIDHVVERCEEFFRQV